MVGLLADAVIATIPSWEDGTSPIGVSKWCSSNKICMSFTIFMTPCCPRIDHSTQHGFFNLVFLIIHVVFYQIGLSCITSQIPRPEAEIGMQRSGWTTAVSALLSSLQQRLAADAELRFMLLASLHYGTGR